MFVSRHYAAKIWPAAERKAALARAMEQKGAYILPVRIDDTELEGLLPIVDYKSYDRYGTEGIVDLILQKLGCGWGAASPSAGPTAPAKPFNFPATKIKRSFDDLEKDKFLRDGFATIREYFKAGLRQLENSSPDVTTKFEAVSSTKFLCSVYVQGKLKHECKIWLGGSYGGASQDKICYYEGTRINRDQDGSTNDMISLANDGFTLGFGKGMASAFGTATPSKNLRTGEEVATDLWQRSTARLGA